MNEVNSTSTTNSSVPAFVLMLQYLLHQQQNITDNKCRKYVDRISKLSEERQEIKKEKERIDAMLAILQEKYLSLEMKLKAIEVENEVRELQYSPQNNCICNCTEVDEKSNCKLPHTESSDTQSLEKLQKFFEIFLKKKNAECSKDRALLVAARMNDTAVTAALLNAGTNVNTEDPSSWERTPLHWAAVFNHIEIARILLTGGADIESRETGVYNMYTPLHEAAKYGHIMMCMLLLDACANTNSRDRDGSTPLHTAARNGHLEVVKLLVNRGSSIIAQDRWGHIPSDRARKYRHYEVVDWLSKAEHHYRLKIQQDTK